MKGRMLIRLLRLAVVVAAGLLLTACPTQTSSSSSTNTLNTTTTPNTAGTASGQVVFSITGSASGGVEGHGTTAAGPGDVATWNSYTMPFHASMPYVPPPAGPLRYSLFTTFDSSGTATCTISFAGHTYTGESGPGSNSADPKAQQVCVLLVDYTGGFGWQQ
jgi:hypothetical protein